jgi:hypothetical protein
MTRRSLGQHYLVDERIVSRIMDLAAIKKRIGYRICLWGGVSGAITVELGTEGEVRAAVRQAIEALGPDSFILSPVDNITADDAKTWRNVDVFLDEWRRRR